MICIDRFQDLITENSYLISTVFEPSLTRNMTIGQMTLFQRIQSVLLIRIRHFDFFVQFWVAAYLRNVILLDSSD